MCIRDSLRERPSHGYGSTRLRSRFLCTRTVPKQCHLDETPVSYGRNSSFIREKLQFHREETPVSSGGNSEPLGETIGAPLISARWSLLLASPHRVTCHPNRAVLSFYKGICQEHLSIEEVCVPLSYQNVGI